MVLEVEDFYGCYLLYCENPKYKGRTYIGYTVDPNRRINQHNRGKKAGGAWRTSGKGPWSMVLIVHGFPNEISALRFEWAWQHPDRSRRLKTIAIKKKNEHGYRYRFRVLSHMLRTGPWNRLPLTVRWLKPEYKLEFDPDLLPPTHIALAYGPVVSKKVQSPKKGLSQRGGKSKKGAAGETDSVKNDDDLVGIDVVSKRCTLCSKNIKSPDDKLRCLHRHCTMQSHLQCLARYFLRGSDKILPVEGDCPKCHGSLLWGEVIRQWKGCYQSLNETEATGHWADELQAN